MASLFPTLLAQGQVVQENFDEEESYAYRKELTGGINFNTVGGIPGGIRTKFAWERKKKPKQFNNISLDIVNIRHPKEFRAAADSGNGYFIPNKMNYLFVIRPNFSREITLFRKSNEDGIELKLVLSAGPSLGLVKPYYIAVSTGGGGTKNVPYTPGIRASRILGSSFFDGFGEIKLEPGVNARASLEFGISAWDDFVTGVELGFMVETFRDKIILLPFAENRATFTSAFVTLYFGKRYP